MTAATAREVPLDAKGVRNVRHPRIEVGARTKHLRFSGQGGQAPRQSEQGASASVGPNAARAERRGKGRKPPSVYYVHFEHPELMNPFNLPSIFIVGVRRDTRVVDPGARAGHGNGGVLRGREARSRDRAACIKGQRAGQGEIHLSASTWRMRIERP